MQPMHCKRLAVGVAVVNRLLYAIGKLLSRVNQNRILINLNIL